MSDQTTRVQPGQGQPVVMPDDGWYDDGDGYDYGHECELCGADWPINDMGCDACGAQGCDRCIHHSMDDCIGYLCSACMKALARGGKRAANVMAMRFGGQQA